MKLKSAILVLGLSLVVVGVVGVNLLQGRQGPPKMVVYKSATCGCCAKWAEQMKEAGFDVETQDLQNMRTAKQRYGVPRTAESCHTAVVEGYVIEGHVPAVYIQRLLEEKPDVKGLAVPGMPIGSPGMEGPNPQPYNVLAVSHDQQTSVYAHVPANPQ